MSSASHDLAQRRSQAAAVASLVYVGDPCILAHGIGMLSSEGLGSYPGGLPRKADASAAQRAPEDVEADQRDQHHKQAVQVRCSHGLDIASA
eukprot:1267018-Rhodomonas_salina.2